MRKIDYTKPVRLRGDRRPIKVDHVTENGFAIVSGRSGTEFRGSWIMFKPDGTFHCSDDGCGTGLKVEQDPDHILDEIEDRLAKSSTASFLLYREDLEALVKLAREGSR